MNYQSDSIQQLKEIIKKDYGLILSEEEMVILKDRITRLIKLTSNHLKAKYDQSILQTKNNEVVSESSGK
jgi:hypothetical protein